MAAWRLHWGWDWYAWPDKFLKIKSYKGNCRHKILQGDNGCFFHIIEQIFPKEKQHKWVNNVPKMAERIIQVTT